MYTKICLVAKGVFGTITIEPLKQHDLETFFQVSRNTITSTIEDALTQKKGLKVQIVVSLELVKTNPATGENLYATPYFRSLMVAITESTDLDFEITVMVAKIKESMVKYMRKGSGWVFNHIEQLKIHLNKFKPLAGSSYIPLPSELARRKAIINVQNKDDPTVERWYKIHQ